MLPAETDYVIASLARRECADVSEENDGGPAAGHCDRPVLVQHMRPLQGAPGWKTTGHGRFDSCTLQLSMGGVGRIFPWRVTVVKFHSNLSETEGKTFFYQKVNIKMSNFKIRGGQVPLGLLSTPVRSCISCQDVLL